MKQQSFKKRGRSQTQEKWVSWFVINSSEPKWYIFVTRRMSRVAVPAASGQHFIFFRTIYRTNEQGYDQFDHIWGAPAIVPYNNIPDKISPSLLSSRTLYLMRACAGRPIRWSSMTQRLSQPFPGPRNPPNFCRVCNIPHISPAVHYFPRGSNTRGNKFGPDFSEEESARRRRDPPLQRSRLPRPPE